MKAQCENAFCLIPRYLQNAPNSILGRAKYSCPVRYSPFLGCIDCATLRLEFAPGARSAGFLWIATLPSSVPLSFYH